MSAHAIVVGVLYMCAAGSLCCSLLLWRIAAVNRYMSSVIDAVSAAAKDDIRKRREWEWRYDAFDVCRDFDALMFRFWTSPSKFYKDRSFMEPRA